MKNKWQILIVIALCAGLVLSWVVFLFAYRKQVDDKLIDSGKMATAIGMAYILEEYPEYCDTERYEFLPNHYADDGYWTVAVVDTQDSTLNALPMVQFTENGKLIWIDLVNEGIIE